MSHTGSLAGSQAAYRAAFERAGAVLVDDYEALIETANFFARAGLPKARGVAVTSTSGGAAIMAADKVEKHGVELPQPHTETTAVLVQHIPDFGSSRNPCDVTAQVMTHPGSLTAVGDALLSDNHYGALVFPAPTAADYVAPRLHAFEELSVAHGKPVCVVWLSLWQEGPGLREALQQAHAPVFHSMDRCFATLAAWHRWDDLRRGGERVLDRLADPVAAPRAAALLAQTTHRTLTEREAKNVLALYGVPVVEEHLAHSREDALAAASTLGFPVAIKVESPDIQHKTEAGVVRLNLKTEADLNAAYDAVLANAGRNAPAAHINGVLVQPMVSPGTEIMVGARVDPQLGPMIVVGLEFIRRFLLHVLPSGFQRIRHYGTLANCCREAKLTRCRELLQAPAPETPATPEEPTDYRDRYERLTGMSLRDCTHCGRGQMVCIETFFPGNLPRAPPGTAS